MREVIINGVDCNDKVESVVFHSSIGEGSGVEIYTLPSLPEIQAYSSITVKMNNEVVFDGYVGAPELTIGGPDAHIISAKYDCYDDGVGFKDILITGEYVGSPQEIMNQIIEAHKNDFPKLLEYTFHFQTSVDVNISAVYTYTEFNSVCDQLASQMAGQWSVAPGNKVYFFQDSISDIEGTYKTIQYSNVQTPYKYRKATDEVINKVTVLGGEADAVRTETWIYDGTNEWKFPEPPMSVTATINGDPAYLVPEGYSGDPYSASDQDLKNTYDNKAFSTGGTANPKGFTHVVVHHIAAKTGTLEQLWDWHVSDRGWTSIGYHWYVRKDGSVHSTCPETEYGAHVKGHNAYTIGIAVEGDYENFDTSMPQVQFKALVAKIIDVMDRMKMPRTNLLYHGELTNTACPGKYFPKNDVRKAVQSGSSNYVYKPVTTVAGADSTKRLIYDTANGLLKTVPDYKPPIGAKIEITYSTTYFVSAEKIDAASVRKYGKVIPWVEITDSARSKEEAMAIADSILNQKANIKETLSLELVYYQQLFGGDKVYLPWLNRYGLVISTQGELNYNKVQYNRMGCEVQLI